jgi:hypothetical protein
VLWANCRSSLVSLEQSSEERKVVLVSLRIRSSRVHWDGHSWHCPLWWSSGKHSCISSCSQHLHLVRTFSNSILNKNGLCTTVAWRARLIGTGSISPKVLQKLTRYQTCIENSIL